MPWIWRYEDGKGTPVTETDLPAPEFPTQADAESWLGENWRDLLDGGVDQVSLLNGDVVVYGPMGLRPAG
ncbi:MAG: hypothetical protein L0Y54_05590 [Sporichthyaceae bacterium]|nr:hypothetical protein [Sporichthyaceae bacterium]